MSNFASRSLKTRLVLAVIASAMIASAGLLLGTQLLERSDSLNVSERTLRSAVELRTQNLANLEAELEGEISYLAKSPFIGTALIDFVGALEELVDFDEVDLTRSAYIEESPFPVGERHMLDAADDGTLYSQIHRRIQSNLREFLLSNGYYDVFLIELDGWIVHTIYKEDDFLTNLESGPYADSGLAKAFQLAKTASDGEVSFVDFAPYAPSGNAAAAFFSVPVFVNDPVSGEPVRRGVLAIQLPEEPLAAAIRSSDPQQNSTSYVVGPDGRLRVDVSATEQNDILASNFDATELADDKTYVVSKRTGIMGVSAHVMEQPVTFLGADWHMVTERPLSAVTEGADQQLKMSLMTLVPVLALIGSIAWYFSGRELRPIIGIDAAMDALVGGDLDTVIPGTERVDELGAMARKTETFRQRIRDADSARQKQAQLDAEAEQARARMVAELSDRFGVVVGDAIRGDFAGRVEAGFDDAELNDLANGINRLLETTQSGLDDVANVMRALSSGDVSAHVNGSYEGAFADLKSSVNRTVAKLAELLDQIAAATASVRENGDQISEESQTLAKTTGQQAASLEETSVTVETMSASIQSTADSATTASDLAAQASQRAQLGGQVVKNAISAMVEIEESAVRIAEIITAIDGISFQTNLLALNAAVEAARAGEDGKGFAVVAQEVRSLAQRSTDASNDIRALIEKSTKQVSDGVNLVKNTGTALDEIVGSVNQVASAISSIADTSQEQAINVKSVTATMTNIDQLTQQSAAMAERSASLSQAISESSVQLEGLVAYFTTSPLRSEDKAA